MRKKMHTPLPPSPDHDLHHVADDIFRRMEYSPGPINTDDAKEKHDHHHEQKKAFAQLLSGFFQKLAMGVPPPLPAAARGMLGAAKAVKPMAKPGTAAILAGAGTGFRQAPALNPFKAAADLTPAARAKLPGSDFAVKAKKSNTGEEAYPIPDRQHARSALGFAKMHGDSADLAAVRKKIQAKYPDMLKSAQYHSFFTKTAGSLLARMGKAVSSETGAHATDLAGLGILAAPVADEVQAHGRAMAAGEHNKAGVEKRTVLPHGAGAAMELGGLGVLAAPSAAHLMARH